MFKIYNSQALNRNQRFLKALGYGIGSTVILTVLYGLIANTIRIEFSVVYLAFGFAIGTVIQKMGRGVQPRFSILGAVLAFICFFFGDMIAHVGFQVFTDLDLFMLGCRWVFAIWTNISVNGLLSLMFRLGGIYFAYQSARIV